VDVNKKVRHSNETPMKDEYVDFTQDNNIPIPPVLEEEKKDTMINIVSKKEKKSDEAGSFSKFWNWATQLF
jgi:cell division protein FtsA